MGEFNNNTYKNDKNNTVRDVLNGIRDNIQKKIKDNKELKLGQLAIPYKKNIYTEDRFMDFIKEINYNIDTWKQIKKKNSSIKKKRKQIK